ncbi:uncharacterized protein HaLaN_21894, partial [Haematococcus lacustris]
MNLPMLQDLAVMLDQENPDLFKWLTGQLPPSELMASNMAFKVCSLPLLQLLSLHDNQITHLPEAVATLPSLITLDLQFNPLRQLPDSLMAVRKTTLQDHNRA